MMNYLAVDTASAYLSVALSYNGKTYAVYKDNCAMRHSVELMPAVDKLLKEAGASVNEMDFFACTVGAGSFTGIRIGVSAIKGFALATGKKILPVTTFYAAAYNGEGKKILSLCDAMHGHYYACAYNENGEETFAPSYIGADEVRKFAAEGYLLRSLEELSLPEDLTYARLSPEKALIGAVEKLAADDKNFAEPRALYVRKCQAEAEREKHGGVASGENP